MPDTVFVKETGCDSAMYTCLDAKEGKQEAVAKYLDENILKKDPTYVEKSILMYQKEFKHYLEKFYVLGGILAGMLSLIGIMNCFNTSATSIFYAKKGTDAIGNPWNDKKTD